MKKTLNLSTGLVAVILAAALVCTTGPAFARVVGLFGDRLHVEATPRSATPDVSVGDDDAYINGTLEVDGAARFDGAVTVNAGITGAMTPTSSVITALNASTTAQIIYGAASQTADLLRISTSTTAGTHQVRVDKDGVVRLGGGSSLVGNVTGALTGNADTATALAANPTDCSANEYATGIAASGNLTCSGTLTPTSVTASSTLSAIGSVRVSSISTSGYPAGWLGVFETTPPSNHKLGDMAFDLTKSALALSTATFTDSSSGWLYQQVTAGAAAWTAY